jgi:hypothetical protein
MADQMTGVSPGVSLSTGGVPGSNRIDYAKPKSSTQRAAFARAESQGAQEPFIGAIGEEPRTTRQVSKGRTPEQVEQVMREYAAKKGEQVDPIKLEQYKRDNASLRADQAQLEENSAVKRVIREADMPMSPSQERAYRGAQYPANTSGGSSGVGTRPTAVAAAPEPQRGEPMPQSMRKELMSLPGPVRDASDQLKTEIAARVDQKRRGRRNNILKAGGLFAGGVGIGAGIDAYNGSREEQY